MTVNVSSHLERRVAEVSREPGDLGTAFERPLGECVPEAVERPLLGVGPTRRISALTIAG